MADTATAAPAASTPSPAPSSPGSNGASGPQTPATKATGLSASNEPGIAANEPKPESKRYRYKADDGNEAEISEDEIFEARLKDYKRKVKVKVGEQEEERELGLDEMEKGYLRRDLFDRKVSEAHRAVQEASQVRKLLEERPVDLMRHLMKGDPEAIYDFAQKLIEPFVRRAEMTPEQRQLDEEREKLTQEKAEIERWRKEQAEVQTKARLDKVGLSVDQQIHTAMTKHGLDPSDTLLIGRLAMAREWTLDNGLPYSFDDLAADLAQKEQVRVEAAAKKLEAQRLEKLKTTPMAQVTTPSAQKPVNGEKPERRWQSPDDYLASLDNKFR